VMRNLEEDRVAFCGSSMMSAQWRSGGNGRRRKEGVLHGGVAPFKGGKRRWTTAAWRRESVGGETAVRTQLARGSDRETDTRGPRGFIISQIIQTSSNMEIENGCFTVLQKFPIFA
jgi:hypothetical protein